MAYDELYKWVNDIYDPSQISDAYSKEAILNRPLEEASEADKIKREKILRGAHKMPIGYIDEAENTPEYREQVYRAKLARDASAPIPSEPLAQSSDGLDAYRKYWAEKDNPEEGFLDGIIRKGKQFYYDIFPQVPESTGNNPYGYTIYDFYPDAKMVGDVVDYGERVRP